MRLVEAKNLDSGLFRVSDQRLIKRFGISCRTFQLSLHLTRPRQHPYPHQLFTYNTVLTRLYHESCIFYLLSIVNSTNMQRVAAIFNVQMWGIFNSNKGQKCKFRDSRKLIDCCMYTIEEVGTAQFKCKLSSI